MTKLEGQQLINKNSCLSFSPPSHPGQWNTVAQSGAPTPKTHTGQCKRTGGCYNELVVAFLRTGDGLKGKKSIPVDFMIYL